MNKTLLIGIGIGIGLLAPAVHAEITSPIEITFDTAQSQVNADQDLEKRLEAAAREMNSYPYAKMEIEGHADTVGSDSSNQKLSEDRAESVKKYFTGKYGIDPCRISARGYGETRAVATNGTSAGHELNRRAVIRIYRLQPNAGASPRYL